MRREAGREGGRRGKERELIDTPSEVLYAALFASIYSYGQVAQRKRTLVNYSNNENYNTSIYSLLLALFALLSLLLLL